MVVDMSCWDIHNVVSSYEAEAFALVDGDQEAVLELLLGAVLRHDERVKARVRRWQLFAVGTRALNLELEFSQAADGGSLGSGREHEELREVT